MNTNSIIRLYAIVFALFVASNLAATSQVTVGIDVNLLEPVGVVQINHASGYTTTQIAATGHCDVYIPGPPTSVTINGQTVAAGSSGIVTLATQTSVHVEWNGGTSITIWADMD